MHKSIICGYTNIVGNIIIHYILHSKYFYGAECFSNSQNGQINKPMLSCLIKTWACGNTGLYQIPCVAYSIENRDSHCSIIDSLPGALDAL